MKLYYSATSPYARKARVVALEKGLNQLTFVEINPFEASDQVMVHNPLGKIPFLLRDDAAPLYDSPVICQYLDGLSQQAPLYPALNSASRWDVLCQDALAHGILDSAVTIAMEGRREASLQSKAVVSRNVTGIAASLDVLEALVPQFDDLNIVTITAGCALDYLDLRVSAHLDWREGHPNLTSWFETFGARPSMVATRPA